MSQDQIDQMDPDADSMADGRSREERGADLEPREPRATELPPANVILVGGMGAGKSAVGWCLARCIGYGFIDLDRVIEKRERKQISTIFAEQGEEYFRKVEAEAVLRLGGLRSHVVAVGGGTVASDANWEFLSQLGTSVWLNTPPAEIARRFASDLGQIRRRPLLGDVADMEDHEQRHKLLTERLTTMLGNRMTRYGEAKVAVSDSFSTPESTARLVRDILASEGFLGLPSAHQPFNRWGML